MASNLLAFLFGHRGRFGRLSFLAVELVRATLLGICYALYRLHNDVATVLAATLLWAALWPGIVGTIKRFRDLNVDPIYILPVLMWLSTGFAVGHVMNMPVIGLVTLGLYLAVVLGTPGRHPDADS